MGTPLTLPVVKVTVLEDRFLHPLAGKDIKYKVKVIAVKDPAVALPPPPPAEAVLTDDEIKEEK